MQTNGQQLASSFSRTTTTANAEQVEVGILSHVYCTRASSRSPILTASAQGRGQRPAALCRPKSFARVLNTKGWQPSIQAQLKVGEYLQIGQRLHMVIGQDVDSDDQGNATINIWPSNPRSAE